MLSAFIVRQKIEGVIIGGYSVRGGRNEQERTRRDKYQSVEMNKTEGKLNVTQNEGRFDFSCEKVWWFQGKAIPLHRFRNDVVEIFKYYTS